MSQKTKRPSAQKISKKSSKKMLKFNGSCFPSIYQTARGDFYCTYRRKKIYLGRDPERAKVKERMAVG